jgi:hypothetical protein
MIGHPPTDVVQFKLVYGIVPKAGMVIEHSAIKFKLASVVWSQKLIIYESVK